MTQFELSVRSCVQALAQSAPKVGDLLHFWEITLRTVSSIYALISKIELTFPYCLYIFPELLTIMIATRFLDSIVFNNQFQSIVGSNDHTCVIVTWHDDQNFQLDHDFGFDQSTRSTIVSNSAKFCLFNPLNLALPSFCRRWSRSCRWCSATRASSSCPGSSGGDSIA